MADDFRSRLSERLASFSMRQAAYECAYREWQKNASIRRNEKARLAARKDLPKWKKRILSAARWGRTEIHVQQNIFRIFRRVSNYAFRDNTRSSYCGELASLLKLPVEPTRLEVGGGGSWGGPNMSHWNGVKVHFSDISRVAPIPR